ncbi:hypothetical protein, partial [Streptomyces shenzhenensis]|uniref:hypothetical protein n=1 Tax=Streptomyces shenzhenensis TaxID=943815 RepID=UPI00340FA43A
MPRSEWAMGEAVVSVPQADPSVRCGTGIPGGSTRTTGSFDAAHPAVSSLALSSPVMSSRAGRRPGRGVPGAPAGAAVPRRRDGSAGHH